MNNNLTWTTSSGNNQRTGLFGSESKVKSTTKFVLKAQGPIHTSPVCAADGRIFVIDAGGYGSMFSRDGYLEGTRKLKGAVHASPALTPDGSKIFIGTVDGYASCYDTSNGDLIWQVKVPTQRDPRILSDLLYVEPHNLVVLSSWGGRYVALDANTGTTQFGWNAGQNPYAAATADQAGNIYTLSVNVNWENNENKSTFDIIKVDGKTGETTTLHSQPRSENFPIGETQFSAAPVLDEQNNRLWIILNHDETSRLASIDLEQNKLVLADYIFERNILATPCLNADGQVVVADMNGNVKCFIPLEVSDSPKPYYATKAHYLLAGPIADQSGSIYQADVEGRLHRITTDGEGEVIFEAPRSIEAKPAFTPDGNVLLPCTDGKVYCL